MKIELCPALIKSLKNADAARNNARGKVPGGVLSALQNGSFINRVDMAGGGGWPNVHITT